MRMQPASSGGLVQLTETSSFGIFDVSTTTLGQVSENFVKFGSSFSKKPISPDSSFSLSAVIRNLMNFWLTFPLVSPCKLTGTADRSFTNDIAVPQPVDADSKYSNN